MKGVDVMLIRFDIAVGKFLRAVTAATLGLLFVLLLGNVFFRFVPIFSFGWFDEIVEMCFAYFVFFGSAALFRENEHFVINLIPGKLKGRMSGKALSLCIEVVNLLFFAVLFYYSLEITLRAADQTPIFKLPKKLLYVCIPASSFAMSVYAVRNILRHCRRAD